MLKSIVSSMIFLPLYSYCMHDHAIHQNLPTTPPLKIIQAWRDPSSDPTQKISTQFPLMGKQMGSVITPGIQPLGYELDGAIKVFHLTAQPIETTLVDTKQSLLHELMPKKNQPYTVMPHDLVQKLKCWGYNGSMPGPTIEAVKGDTVRIIVKNELPEPTSIHWHGITVPNDQDGAAPETQRPIMPGETYTYQFTVHQTGTFMYHSGFNEMKQNSWGLQGIFVIHPQQYKKPIDVDVAIMLQEWKIQPGSEYPDLVSLDFNWFTFNGHAAPNIPVITAKEGQRVRLRFANMSMDSHPIHLHGYTWEEVGTDGGPIPPSARRRGSTINVPPGSTRDVEFVAWNPGVWRLHCHKLHHIVNAHAQVPMSIMEHGGMFTLLHVITQAKDHPKKDLLKDKKQSNPLNVKE